MSSFSTKKNVMLVLTSDILVGRVYKSGDGENFAELDFFSPWCVAAVVIFSVN